MTDNANAGKLESVETPQAPRAYLGLARKYRPQHFGDLVGQEAMVRTLQNAFKSDRVAHAFMFTGIRGVGKTTTARILARALNYAPAKRETINVADLDFAQALPSGVFCEAIMHGRCADVVEMDAASHGGIDDIRELIGNAHYRPMAARYKVYIIDEVHMLSTEAFNGLLKTLEEPPAHVKFIFATTEIRKVPITVLSRCQRFDLRRLDTTATIRLLQKVCQQEDMALSEEILAMLARAADGSARDGLSLLDRVLTHTSHSNDPPSVEEVRVMLGLADRGRLFDLLEHILKGDVAKSLDELQAQYATGADASNILAELAALIHWLGRLKFVPDSDGDMGIADAQNKQAQLMADTMSVPVLSRLWQVLLKGHHEVVTSPMPLAAAEMVLIRLAHITTQPTPEALIRQWRNAEAPPIAASAEAAEAVGSPSQNSTKTIAKDPPSKASKDKTSSMLDSAKSLFPDATVVSPSPAGGNDKANS